MYSRNTRQSGDKQRCPRHFYAWAIIGLIIHISAVTAASTTTLDQLLELSLDELMEYTVSAPTRTETQLAYTPGAVSLISYDQIQRSSARTIPEILRLVPGLNVRWNPMVQTIDVRSFGSNPFTSKVLLLIDGVPYNSWNKGGFPQHPGFDFFNLQNVKHIEVIRGSGSALYGENAFNGVINIVTLSGEEVNQTKASLFTGERDTVSLGLSQGSQLFADGSIFASVRLNKSQLPLELWAEESDADAKSYDVFLKGKYKNFELSYFRTEDDFDGFEQHLETAAFPPGTAFRSADTIKQNVNIIAGNYKHFAEDGSWSIKVNGSYSNRFGSHCAGCHGPNEAQKFSGDEDHGYQALLGIQASIHTIKHHQLLVGGEVKHIAAGNHEHELHGHDSSPIRETVTEYTKAALYVQDEMSFFENRLKLIGGLRYETQTFPNLFGDELFPRVSVIGKPLEQLTLRVGWSRAARYPSFSEIYQDTWFLSAETPTVVIPLAQFNPNPELGPEYIETFEFGIDYELSKHWHTRLDFYHNEIDDSIILAYPRFSFENHPNDVRTHGVELEVRGELWSKLSLIGNWSYQINEQTHNGTDSTGSEIEFSYSPKHKANLSAHYSVSDRLSSTLEVTWRDEYFGPSFWYPLAFEARPEVRPLDDYTYVNLRLRYNIPITRNENKDKLSLNIYAKNLLNEQPFETLTGFGGRVVGREFFVGVEYDWSM